MKDRLLKALACLASEEYQHEFIVAYMAQRDGEARRGWSHKRLVLLVAGACFGTVQCSRYSPQAVPARSLC